MSENLYDCEFWLPPAILSDDEEFRPQKKSNSTDPFPHGFGLGLRTHCPNSCLGSFDSRSDADENMFGLNRFNQERNQKVSSGSPKSTLCHMGVLGCECSLGSPEIWEVLSAVAGEVIKRRLCGVSRHGTGYYCEQSGLKAGQVRQIEMMKQRQLRQQMIQSRLLNDSNAWHQQTLPALRGPLLNGNKRRSAGTGVFLPRRITSPPDPQEMNLRVMGRNPGQDCDASATPQSLTCPEIQLPQEWTY